MKINADTKGEPAKNSIWPEYFKMGRLSNGKRVETKGVPYKKGMSMHMSVCKETGKPRKKWILKVNSCGNFITCQTLY